MDRLSDDVDPDETLGLLIPDRSFAENRLIVHCHINRAESRCEQGMPPLVGDSREHADDLRYVCRLRDSIDR